MQRVEWTIGGVPLRECSLDALIEEREAGAWFLKRGCEGKFKKLFAIEAEIRHRTRDNVSLLGV